MTQPDAPVPTAEFLDIAASWPLSQADFDLLCHLTGLFQTSVTATSRAEFAPADGARRLSVPEEALRASLTALQKSGYITWDDAGGMVSLQPLFRAIAIYYALIARHDHRAWLTLARFPDEPISIVELEHALPDNTAIATFTINAWDRLRPYILGQRWVLNELRDVLSGRVAPKPKGRASQLSLEL